MTVNNTEIKKLLIHYKELMLLEHMRALLNWDLNVYMPPKASAGRAEQTALLAKLIVERWLDPTFRRTLEKATSLSSLTDDEQAIVRNLNYHGKFYFKVPKDIIIKHEHTTSEAFIPWRKAREENNFKKFAPYLKKIYALQQQIAEAIGYKENPYDVLLELHEPELTAKTCQTLFDNLKIELVSLLHKIKNSKHYTETMPFLNSEIKYPRIDQERLLDYILQKMGFDLTAGRLDVSPHPFTTNPDRYDTRITTNFSEHDFRDSFSSTMHETGHALYEQAIDPSFADTPFDGGVSMGIHEALSRFWENMIGRNINFLDFITPTMQTLYSKQLIYTNENDIIKAFNLVHPSFIRIEADEVTYSLHIILRFEMENALMNNKITVTEAPDLWRAKFKQYFGIEPATDSEGILQDVHWAYGSIGYFPSYALGNLYGAQFLSAMKKDVEVENTLSKGNLLPIKEWLDKHIHIHGSKYTPKELIKKVTGKPLDYTYFVKYLNEKYSKLYNLPK